MQVAGVRAASSSGLRGSSAPAKVGNNLLILSGMNNKRSIHKAFLDCIVPARSNVIWMHLWVWWENVYACRREQLYGSEKTEMSHSFFWKHFWYKMFWNIFALPQHSQRKHFLYLLNHRDSSPKNLSCYQGMVRGPVQVRGCRAWCKPPWLSLFTHPRIKPVCGYFFECNTKRENSHS